MPTPPAGPDDLVPAARRPRRYWLAGLPLGALLTVALLMAGRDVPPADPAGWPVYGGDPGHTRYAALDQIHRGNVDRLEVAWTYHTGDHRADPPSTMEVNPIVVDGVLYATSPMLKVFALDAATGAEQWVFDPFEGEQARGVNRGVTYWADGDDRRILFTAGPRLYALDADTGRPIPSFGDGGTVDLRQGLDRDIGDVFVAASSPGIVYGDLLILGSWVSEGPQETAPGHVRAYDIRTGERAWIFHTIPHPGEAGYATWPADAWQTAGGANAWGGMSLDPARGLVFIATGSPAYDFYGGDRHGQNLFANAVVALRAGTGAYVWHFQAVHHDLWDYDLPCPPNLVTVTHAGRRVDAVAQVTKTGHVFLLDRETGAPLFPVEERSVPASTLAGEAASPTQPFPTKPPPFTRQGFTRDDITDRTPEAHASVAARFDDVRGGRMFIPPSRAGSLMLPGFHGGAEWSGASFDPETGLLYVNANEIPWLITMVGTTPREGASAGEVAYRTNCASCHGLERRGEPPTYPALLGLRNRLSRPEVETILQDGQGRMPSFGHLSEAEQTAIIDYLFGTPGASTLRRAEAATKYPYVHTGWHRFLDPEGYPASKPPWGTLNAIDLNAGTIAWQVPLGEVPALTEAGLPPTGTENFGGTIVTAGGLIFVAATTDERFRAFDKATGAMLWETQLPAGGYATPSTYAVGGRQYVVIAAGGGGKLGTPAGDALVAFALPE